MDGYVPVYIDMYASINHMGKNIEVKPSVLNPGVLNLNLKCPSHWHSMVTPTTEFS